MLLAAEEAEVVVSKPNIGLNIEVAKPQTFNGETEKVLGFLMACRLYIRMRIRKAVVEEQIQCVLSYI